MTPNPFRSLLTLIFIATTLPSCTTGTTTTLATTSPESTITTSTPSGVPTITLTPDPHPATWLITVTQPYTTRTAIKITHTWHTQRYVVFPPAIFLGLIQCPIGSLVQLVTWRQPPTAWFTHGCQRLLGREPIPDPLSATSTTEDEISSTTTSGPLPHGQVLISWPTSTSPTLSFSLTAEGTALFSLTDLLDQWPVDQPFPSYMWEQPLTIALQAFNSPTTTTLWVPSTLFTGKRPHPTRPLQQTDLPHPPIAQVEAANPMWRAHLEQWLLKTGWCLAANSTIQNWLKTELEFQYSGRTSDEEQIRIGAWHPATILFTADLTHTPTLTQARLTIFHIPQGKILKTWTASLPTGNESILLQQLVTTLSTALPKLSCSLTSASSPTP